MFLVTDIDGFSREFKTREEADRKAFYLCLLAKTKDENRPYVASISVGGEVLKTYGTHKDITLPT